MDWRGTLANIAALLLILGATATACESLLRRREARKLFGPATQAKKVVRKRVRPTTILYAALVSNLS
jgi:hypothetical protein